ncbi:hypothetical protein PIB30_092108, partial [Stylosanthes scabra]|nr:hypothetical protein [Stylosanthes scabra]
MYLSRHTRLGIIEGIENQMGSGPWMGRMGNKVVCFLWPQQKFNNSLSKKSHCELLRPQCDQVEEAEDTHVATFGEIAKSILTPSTHLKKAAPKGQTCADQKNPKRHTRRNSNSPLTTTFRCDNIRLAH